MNPFIEKGKNITSQRKKITSESQFQFKYEFDSHFMF